MEKQNAMKETGPGVSPWAFSVDGLAGIDGVRSLSIDNCDVRVCQSRDSVWVMCTREGHGGFALRAAYFPGGSFELDIRSKQDAIEIIATGAIGRFHVRVGAPDNSRSMLRMRTSIKPSANVNIPFWPRDLYPVDIDGSPLKTRGQIYAEQRGLCSGVVYLSLEDPAFGAILYGQNLTAANDYFRLTGTTPANSVGGTWPELGYAMPVSAEKPLPAGKEVVLSDALVAWDARVPQDPQDIAQTYLDLLASIYVHFDRPDTLYHDWPACAQQTLADLQSSPDVTVKQYGNIYLRAYVDAEYPDSMVQMTVLTPMLELAEWLGTDIDFVHKLRAGMKHFYNDEAGTIVRYLPTVGKDKNPREVESWYLYHPLHNLGRLALRGDKEACELFLKSMDYAIKVAHHFHYEWPVKFDLLTLDVITAKREGGQPGQSDAGGLYAYVMLEAWELTQEKRYIEEAKRAIDAVRKRDFEMEYQSNLCAWGAIASLRLWMITRNDYYRDQSYVFLANFFRYTLMWESKIGLAEHYPKFLGVASLSDANYMALYECFESYAAFDEYLHWGGENVRQSVQILLTEYCKYTLSRAWFYYPRELPEEIVAKEVRNGHIDRNLAIPLEDLYAEDRPAGQVGQEVYGSGAAFAFTTRAFHRPQAPFMLFCEYPIHEVEAVDIDRLSLRVRGVPGHTCLARIIFTTKSAPDVTVSQGDEHAKVRTRRTREGHLEFTAEAGMSIEIHWKERRDGDVDANEIDSLSAKLRGR